MSYEKNSAIIIQNALYAPTVIIQISPKDNPTHYAFVHEVMQIADVVIIDLDQKKGAYEVLEWYSTIDKKIEVMRDEASRKGGKVITVPSKIRGS